MSDVVLTSKAGARFANAALDGSLTLTGPAGPLKVTQPVGVLKASGVTANGGIGTLPIGAVIRSVMVQNTTANAVTGGLRIGRTSGAADVVAATAVAGNALVPISGALVLLPWFSQSATQQLFISAAVAWNGANVTVWVLYDVLS